MIAGALFDFLTLGLGKVFPPSTPSIELCGSHFIERASDDAKNYRPTSIQSPIVVVFESLVLDHLRHFFEELNLCEQHWVPQGSSTVTNLAVLYLKISSY